MPISQDEIMYRIRCDKLINIVMHTLCVCVCIYTPLYMGVKNHLLYTSPYAYTEGSLLLSSHRTICRGILFTGLESIMINGNKNSIARAYSKGLLSIVLAGQVHTHTYIHTYILFQYRMQLND